MSNYITPAPHHPHTPTHKPTADLLADGAADDKLQAAFLYRLRIPRAQRSNDFRDGYQYARGVDAITTAINTV